MSFALFSGAAAIGMVGAVAAAGAVNALTSRALTGAAGITLVAGVGAMGLGWWHLVALGGAAPRFHLADPGHQRGLVLRRKGEHGGRIAGDWHRPDCDLVLFWQRYEAETPVWREIHLRRAFACREVGNLDLLAVRTDPKALW